LLRSSRANRLKIPLTRNAQYRLEGRRGGKKNGHADWVGCPFFVGADAYAGLSQLA
jgi:hypothetical protein